MRVPLLHIIILFMLTLGVTTRSTAQKGFFIPAGGTIFFVGDSSAIFSDVINRGNVGIGEPATVSFMASTWENESFSKVTDAGANATSTTGKSGWLRFAAKQGRQTILGGYNAATRAGASFAKIRIDNSDGVQIINGSLHVRDEVDFRLGRFYLNDQVLVVGNNDPGKITGYDSTRFFVTGNKPGSGMLLRQRLTKDDGIVVFPVGSRDDEYTPAGIRARLRQVNDYYVGVFDGVISSGMTVQESRPETVNKTWQIGKSGSSSLDESDIFLEHQVRDEGEYFAQNRDQSYISQYSNGQWDEGFPQRTPAMGSMTSTTPSASNGMNGRNFDKLGAIDNYYTKLTGNKSAKTRLWFNAYRIDSGFVKVYWKTNPEVNIRTFTVERRFSNEQAFYAVGSQPSKAIAGYSTIDLKYDMNDPNRYKGVTYYRLRMTGYDNSVTYSQEVPVGPVFGMYEIMLWPNPAVNWFNLAIPSVVPAKTIVIHNVLGQKLREEKVNGRTLVQMTGLLPGTYFVSIYSTSNHLIETKKLVVAGGVE